VYDLQSSYWGDHNWEEGKANDLSFSLYLYIILFFSYNISDDDNDFTARKAFEALLRVSLLQPTSPKFHNFAQTVRERALKTYNYEFYEGEEVS
jgi:atrial natriuretic peptide receptor A